MKTVTFQMKGARSQWSVTCQMHPDAVEDLRAGGHEIGELYNVIPGWIVNLGLLKPYRFLQDVWNFRNPFTD